MGCEEFIENLGEKLVRHHSGVFVVGDDDATYTFASGIGMENGGCVRDRGKSEVCQVRSLGIT